MRKFLIVPVIGVLAMLSVAAAAGLNITNDPVTAQAGSALVLQCDADGVQLYPHSNFEGSPTNDYVLAEVKVAGISSNCVGKILKVTLTGAAGNWLAEASTTITGGDELLVFTAPAPLTAVVFDIHVSIQS